MGSRWILSYLNNVRWINDLVWTYTVTMATWQCLPCTVHYIASLNALYWILTPFLQTMRNTFYTLTHSFLLIFRFFTNKIFILFRVILIYTHTCIHTCIHICIIIILLTRTSPSMFNYALIIIITNNVIHYYYHYLNTWYTEVWPLTLSFRTKSILKALCIQYMNPSSLQWCSTCSIHVSYFAFLI